MRTLETERLILRPFVVEDAAAMHCLVYGDPEVARYYSGEPITLDQVERRMLWWSLYAERREDGLSAVTLKEDGRVIGVCGLQLFIADWARLPEDPPSPHAKLLVELSYALGKEYWGKGYAYEAARACIEYAFRDLKLPRLINAVNESNRPSIELMRRLGFRVARNLSDNFPNTVLGVLDNTLL